MTGKDEYYNRAKVEGYRARSAFKLKQIDRQAGVFGPGNVVVDLGAAPGSWMQVAAEEVGEEGLVIGVDRQRISPLEDVPATVESLRGDLTESATHDEIEETVEEMLGQSDGPGGPVDVVLSDMAPNVSGEYELDHARSVHLARQAHEVAQAVLAGGGDLVVKVFQGRDLDDLEADMEADFEYVRRIVPDATRDSSSEVYLVGKSFLTAPVRAGETHEVTITDVGEEGDGVAHVEDFTVFIPGAREGDEVTIEITDVKERFAFGSIIDD